MSSVMPSNQFNIRDYSQPYVSPGTMLNNFGANSNQPSMINNWGNPMTSVASPVATDPTFMQKMMGYENADGTQFGGWGMPAIAGANSLMQGFLGMKQYGLANDMFKQSKKEFDMNWGVQKNLTNSQLEDRQRARVGASPTAYESVGDYMNKYGVK